MSRRYAEYLFASLPAIFRSEEKDGFTYRFLSIFAETLEEMEDKIYGFHRHLSPLSADRGFLQWLAFWVAFELDENWPVEKQRQLIISAIELYRWRGTIKGIQTFVEIYTGLKPVIVEPFSAGWQLEVKSTLGLDTKIYEPFEDAHCFSVIVMTNEELSDEEKERVMAIVEREKPAHTKVIHYEWYASFWRLGVQSTVGIDVKVGD